MRTGGGYGGGGAGGAAMQQCRRRIGRRALCIAATALAALLGWQPRARARPLLPTLKLVASLEPGSAAPLAPDWLLEREEPPRGHELRRPGRSQWILDLPDLDRAPLYLGMDFDVGTRQLGMRVDGTLRVNADYPALGGHLHLRIRGHDIPVELPWVTVVPRHELGAFYMEVRMTLLERRF